MTGLISAAVPTEELEHALRGYSKIKSFPYGIGSTFEMKRGAFTPRGKENRYTEGVFTIGDRRYDFRSPLLSFCLVIGKSKEWVTASTLNTLYTPRGESPIGLEVVYLARDSRGARKVVTATTRCHAQAYILEDGKLYQGDYCGRFAALACHVSVEEILQHMPAHLSGKKIFLNGKMIEVANNEDDVVINRLMGYKEIIPKCKCGERK